MCVTVTLCAGMCRPALLLLQVYAHMKLGEAEPGFENAPGMLFLAGELYRAATNASLGLGDAAGRTKQLLSFEIEPAGEAGGLGQGSGGAAAGAVSVAAVRSKAGPAQRSMCVHLSHLCCPLHAAGHSQLTVNPLCAAQAPQ